MKIEFDENAIEEAVEEMERSPEFNRMMWRTRWRNRYQKAKRSSCCILKTLSHIILWICAVGGFILSLINFFQN